MKTGVFSYLLGGKNSVLVLLAFILFRLKMFVVGAFFVAFLVLSQKKRHMS